MSALQQENGQAVIQVHFFKLQTRTLYPVDSSQLACHFEFYLISASAALQKQLFKKKQNLEFLAF